MIKTILINILLIKICRGNILSPSPPPGAIKWTFIPKINRTIRKISLVDIYGDVGDTMLSTNKKYLFSLTSSIPDDNSYINNSNLILHIIDSYYGNEIWNTTITDNNSRYFNGKLFVSSTDKVV